MGSSLSVRAGRSIATRQDCRPESQDQMGRRKFDRTALKTLEEASVASRAAAIYFFEPVRREMGIKCPDDIPERSDAWLARRTGVPMARCDRRRLGLTAEVPVINASDSKVPSPSDPSQTLHQSYYRFLCGCDFRKRTPGPPPLPSINSTPAASKERRTAKSFAAVMDVS